jgi:hypothetical protein
LTFWQPNRKIHSFGQLLLAIRTGASARELLQHRVDQCVPARSDLKLNLTKADTISTATYHRDGIVIEFTERHTSGVVEDEPPPRRDQLYDLME